MLLSALWVSPTLAGDLPTPRAASLQPLEAEVGSREGPELGLCRPASPSEILTLPPNCCKQGAWALSVEGSEVTAPVSWGCRED